MIANLNIVESTIGLLPPKAIALPPPISENPRLSQIQKSFTYRSPKVTYPMEEK